ncbi:hypothetical protein DESUT3_08900 [Desulfuromonas versatilis]|uniref:Uncharacterized protein n=1 Tax=Desulfuromonas versatilis TaxID=2802975 RepID=A0ABM8HPX8_9BACT|nr:hypothetical protein DESUT3_08900 [Desulfuromonas versatilis]
MGREIQSGDGGGRRLTAGNQEGQQAEARKKVSSHHSSPWFQGHGNAISAPASCGSRGAGEAPGYRTGITQNLRGNNR